MRIMLRAACATLALACLVAFPTLAAAGYPPGVAIPAAIGISACAAGVTVYALYDQGGPQLTYGHFECLNHHLTHGIVRDGDQVSKALRDDLVRLGMLQRLTIGASAITPHGSAYMLRRRAAFRAWTAARRASWRLREGFARGWREVPA